MQINVPFPTLQTILFTFALFGVLLLTLKRRSFLALDLPTTQELKGFAILAIIFSHIGYFLATDSSFLFPLSVLAGAGVNLFLVLSGYGLSLSQLNRLLSISQFYKRRLMRLFPLLWVVLTIWFLLDFLILKGHYSFVYVLQSYLGLFPGANLYTDIDSPLWYFTLILFFYLLFPWVFGKRYPSLAAPLLLLGLFIFTQFNFPYFWKTNGLYQLHLWAFPLGVLLATSNPFLKRSYDLLANFFLGHTFVLKLILISAGILVSYISVYNSGVGESKIKEQIMSLVVTFSLVGMFALKRYTVKFFQVFGKYSYEIYLIHWPLLYHYGLLYKFLPAASSTLIYIGIFLLAGIALKWIDKSLNRKIFNGRHPF